MAIKSSTAIGSVGVLGMFLATTALSPVFMKFNKTVGMVVAGVGILGTVLSTLGLVLMQCCTKKTQAPKIEKTDEGVSEPLNFNNLLDSPENSPRKLNESKDTSNHLFPNSEAKVVSNPGILSRMLGFIFSNNEHAKQL